MVNNYQKVIENIAKRTRPAGMDLFETEEGLLSESDLGLVVGGGGCGVCGGGEGGGGSSGSEERDGEGRRRSPTPPPKPKPHKP